MTLTVRLPETIESQLTRFCEAMGMSKSQVVQGALKDWFAKPALTQQHPLLAFAEAASNAAPGADWAGPYSKERLRTLVLASGSAHRAAEPVADYPVEAVEPTPAQQQIKKTAKPRLTQATKATRQSKPRQA